jgi:hypothetical protein
VDYDAVTWCCEPVVVLAETSIFRGLARSETGTVTLSTPLS